LQWRTRAAIRKFLKLAGGAAVGRAVVGSGAGDKLGENPRHRQHFDTAVILPTAIGQPLGNEPIVFTPALRGAVSPQQILSAEGDDGLAGLLVKPVGLVVFESSSAELPKEWKTESSVFLSVFGPLCRTSAGA
jgi:hypothetical protein